MTSQTQLPRPATRPSGRGPLWAAIALATSLVLVAGAAAGGYVIRRGTGGPDPYAGAYPAATPAPSSNPKASWTPTGPPKGPLPKFPGQASPVVGRTTDTTAGISYAKLGPPWRRKAGIGAHTGGQEIKSKGTGLKNFWYVAIYSSPLKDEYAPTATGANGLRAAAELIARDFVESFYEDGKRTELAGAPLRAGGHRAWVTALRATKTDPDTPYNSQTEVVVAVDAGRKVPAILEITVPGNQAKRLADINTVVKSLRVV